MEPDFFLADFWPQSTFLNFLIPAMRAEEYRMVSQEGTGQLFS